MKKLIITSTHNIIIAPCKTVKANPDREKIEQVLVNLLSNAAKYSGKDLSIEIVCVMNEKNIEVNVRDPGLSKARRKQENFPFLIIVWKVKKQRKSKAWDRPLFMFGKHQQA